MSAVPEHHGTEFIAVILEKTHFAYLVIAPSLPATGQQVFSWSMHSADDQAPATKADINTMLRVVMGTLEDLERRMATKEDLKRFATKDDLDRFATKMDLLGLEVKFEQLREDVLGSLKDLRSNDRQVADHERRIRTLETNRAR